jgi:endonuclease/exonuclease/phosphatase family metal-dependent hydrolase
LKLRFLEFDAEQTGWSLLTWSIKIRTVVKMRDSGQRSEIAKMVRWPALPCLLLVASCTALTSNLPDSQPANTIRVMTYNIHAGKDAQQADNLARVAAVIDSADADIVLLQEVDRRTQRAAGADHFAELRRLTGMSGVFAKSLDYQGGEYGIAVLSRWPVDSVAAVPLKVEPPQERSGTYESRIALHVLVRTQYGALNVVNTHLDPAATGTFRKQELIGIMSHMRQKIAEEAPLVFGGDLNARPNTDDIHAVSFGLTDAFALCGSGTGETFPAHAPDRRIDYLFLRQARCSSARVIDTRASDHRPMIAIIQLTGGA